jgi:transcriptional regulator with XRE-family HTH domain
MLVNDQIRDLRNKKKISQQEMADFLEITQGAYNRIENGGTEMKVSDLKKIAEKLQVPLADLLAEDNKTIAYNVQTGNNNQNAQNTLTEKERVMLERLMQNQESRILSLESEITRLHSLLEKALMK